MRGQNAHHPANDKNVPRRLCTLSTGRDVVLHRVSACVDQLPVGIEHGLEVALRRRVDALRNRFHTCGIHVIDMAEVATGKSDGLAAFGVRGCAGRDAASDASLEKIAYVLDVPHCSRKQRVVERYEGDALLSLSRPTKRRASDKLGSGMVEAFAQRTH